jgi:hypothetical protein
MDLFEKRCPQCGAKMRKKPKSERKFLKDYPYMEKFGDWEWEYPECWKKAIERMQNEKLKCQVCCHNFGSSRMPNFCPSCGVKLYDPRYCKKCGSLLLGYFCQNCGEENSPI